MWHSCSTSTLTHHFKGKPGLRRLFSRYVALVRSFRRRGDTPVVVIPQKTRIAMQGRVRFAGCAVRGTWLQGGLWLKRRVEDPCFTKVEHVGGRDWIYTFRLEKAADLAGPLTAYLREAYGVGQQDGDRDRAQGIGHRD